MGSSQSSESSSTTTKDVNPALKPYLNDVLTQGQAFYDAGVGSQPYIGPTVAAPNKYLSDSLLNYQGMNDWQISNVGAHPQDLAIKGAEAGGLTPGMDTEINKLQGISGNPNGITTGQQFQDLYGTSLSQNAPTNSAIGALGANAAGQNNDVVGRLTDMTGRDINPYLNDLLNDQTSKIANRVNSSFSGMGRYGSAGNQDTLARSLTAANNPILAGAWENQQQRAMGANQAIAGIRQADTSLSGNLLNASAEGRRADTASALNANAGLTGVQNQNIANQMNASTSALTAQNQAANRGAQYLQMTPGLTELSYAPYMRQGEYGNWLQDRLQQEMNNQIGNYNNLQNMGWSQLAKYMGAVSGVSPAFQGTGVQQTQSSGSSSSPFGGQQAAGLGMSALGKMSDVRAKKDIEKIGTHEMTGLDVYTYRYKGEPGDYPKTVGPMAQDVQRLAPDAVHEVDGYLRIKPEAVALGGLLGF